MQGRYIDDLHVFLNFPVWLDLHFVQTQSRFYNGKVYLDFRDYLPETFHVIKETENPQRVKLAF